MEPGDPRLTVDPMRDSEAWKRLQDPLPKDTDDALRRIKHDSVTVFQSMLLAISSQQGMIVELHSAITQLTSMHGALEKRLFDADQGQVVALRRYIDDEVEAERDRAHESVKNARKDFDADLAKLRTDITNKVDTMSTRAYAAAASFVGMIVLLAIDIAARRAGVR